MIRLQSLLGVFTLLAIAWILSENKRKLPFRLILVGLGMQLFLAFFLIKVPASQGIFLSLNQGVVVLEQATKSGTAFVFGYLGGGPSPFDETFPEAGYVLAFRGLPLVLVISALSSLLFYWGILPRMVRFFSIILQRTMGISGVEGLGTASNIFVGMVEAPLLIKPYLEKVTRSELFTVMTSGMATIAGTVMVLYATILQRAIPDVMGHLLIASIISAPAAVMVSKIMIPEMGKTLAEKIELRIEAGSAMDAITKGTLDGIKLLISIIGMLVVLVALVELCNQLLRFLPDMYGGPISLERLLGTIMAPVAWLMGVPWAEAQVSGSLMGTKTILNEFIAYIELSKLPEESLGLRSRMIMTYAMCGFANPGSLGIMIGGMGAMVPERRDEIVILGLRAIVAGTITTCLKGSVIGIIY